MRTRLLVVGLLFIGTCAYSQKFEVASVKPTESPRVFNLVRPMAGKAGVTTRAATLEAMIRWAYGLTSNRLIIWNNKPKWSQAGFDIDAKGPGTGEDRSQQDLEAMLKNLMEDRFGLKVHTETREIRVFVLTVENPAKIRYAQEQTGKLDQAGKLDTDRPKGTSPATVRGTGMSMSELSKLLAYWAVSRPDLDVIPVVDQTGIERRLDFTLTYAPNVEGMKDPAGNPTPEFEGPTLFQALKDQMGLKLSDGKAMMKVVVIDGAQMPTLN